MRRGIMLEKKINFDVLLVLVLMLFPIGTLISGVFGVVNKILFAVLIVVQGINFLMHKITPRAFVIILLTVICHIFAIFNTVFPLYNLNDIFYFGYTVVYFLYILDNKECFYEALIKCTKYITVIIGIWSLLVFISVLFPSSFVTNGDNTTFVSFAGNTFRLGPSCLFIMILSFFQMKQTEKRWNILLMILPMICLLAGSARTYFVLGCFMFLIALKAFFKKSEYFILSLIPTCLAITIFVVFGGIGQKFIESFKESAYFDALGKFTSGRSVFWVADMKAFFDQGILNQLFGNGFNFVYDVNQTVIYNKIWAHNDFIQLLTTFGYLGLGIYCFMMYTLLSEFFKTIKTKSKLVIFSIIMIWFFNAFFNMFYVYFCSLLSFPLLLFAYMPKKLKK